MVEASLYPALREALKQNEIGDASQYVLSFACKGASGASFGIFQGDTNVNEDARDTLRQVLDAAGLEEANCDRIIGLVSRPCPNGCPLTKSDLNLTNKALSSEQGKALVDAMDGRIFDIITSELDSAIEAAQHRRLSIKPDAQLCIGLWVNMTGAPTTLNRWLAGGTISDLRPPAGPAVMRADVLAYLEKTKFFLIHLKNLKHFQDSVDAGAKLIPEPGTAFFVDKFANTVSKSNITVNVVNTAIKEWHFFGEQEYDLRGHPIKIGHKEGDDGYYQKVAEYWLSGTGTRGLDGRDHAWPWSAAFISWVMKTGGAGDRFRYSTQHSVYIAQSIRDLLNHRQDAGYWGWRLAEHKPAIGDLVCWSRQDGIDYEHQNGGNYKGHCDIVVAVEFGRVFVIGGNVGDSVTRRPLPLNDQGYLVATQQAGETLFAIMEDRFT